MELSLVIAGLRRWWWLIVLSAVVGGLVVGAIVGPPRQLFESTSMVAVAPAAPAPANPDRFVAQQVAVLRSGAFQDRVARRLSIDHGAVEVTVSQQPATDLVSIVVVAANGERARAFAGGMADEYIAYEQEREQERRQRAVAALDERASAIERDLQTLTPTAPGDPSAANVAAQRLRREQEFREVLAAKSQLVARTGEAVSAIVEPATAPRPVSNTRRTVILVGGVLFGEAVGLALATLFARFSSFVLSDTQVIDILAAPLVSRMTIPPARAYAGDTPLPELTTDHASINVVTAHIQSMVGLSAPVRIAVVSAQRGAGATAVSLALARSLSLTGERVVLIDADERNPELSSVASNNGRADRDPVLPTSAPSVRSDPDGRTSIVVKAARLGLRREAVPALMAEAGSGGQFVVVDAGPLLDSIPAQQLCQAADAVVLVVSRRKQRLDVLHTASLRFSKIKDKVLVVSVALRQPRRGSRRAEGRRHRRHRKEQQGVAASAGLGNVSG